MSRGVKICFRNIGRLALITVVLISLSGTALSSDKVRPMCGASTLYPASPVSLYDQVVALSKSNYRLPSGSTVALILPNEAYIYVGSLLGEAYSAISSHKYDRIVIFGYDESANPANIYIGASLNTPIGRSPVDEDFCGQLIDAGSIGFREIVSETCLPRSIELQMPFIQHFFPQTPIVPIGLNGIEAAEAEELGAKVQELSDGIATLFIAATNLSKSFDIKSCETSDNRLVNLLQDAKIATVIDELRTRKINAESSGALIAVLTAAVNSGGVAGKIIRYKNTGRITGDHQHVCGYLAAVILSEKESANEASSLSDRDGARLLRHARSSIEEATGYGENTVLRSEIPDNIQFDGVHIDIIAENRESGIGIMRTGTGLFDAVRNVALASAFNDPRFKPIDKYQLDEIRLRLYIFYNLKRINRIDDFVPGRHGIWLIRGNISAKVFPSEMDLSLKKEDIIGRVCLSAGLFSDAWKARDTELWVFDIVVFEENR